MTTEKPTPRKLIRKRITLPTWPSWPAFGLAFALALGATAVPRAASACGMESFWQPRRNPEALLAEATRFLDQARTGSAVLRARAVLQHRRARPAQRAHAWAIIGWVRWQQGQRAAALEALAQSRALDGDALDGVLAQATDANAVTALRAALKG